MKASWRKPAAFRPKTRNEWQPAEGMERVGYTVMSTLLLGVGYAALLLGGAASVASDHRCARG